MAERKKRKPAREMTTEEAGEWLFGKRGKRKVDRELDPDPQVPEDEEETDDSGDIKD